jgi:putative solute:sodium symporter small subunit
MAAYGAPLAYLVIIGIYARIMNRADERSDDTGGHR